jgi:undecaprenyl-diphosphatase
MTTWEAFLLGLIQGVTEFLPVSSSGHLALGQYLLGYSHLQDYIFFDLVCHLGTLVAIVLVFYTSLTQALTTQRHRFWQVALATLPLFPLVLLIKPLKVLFAQPQFLGPCFLISAALLFAGIFYRFPFAFRKTSKPWKDSLVIGTFQAVAIFPGISRSGATISAAQLLGWTKEEAVRFSFLLAIPAILGASLLEGVQILRTPALLSTVPPLAYAIGFLTSLTVGYGALKLLIQLVKHDQWIYFAWYCLLLGLATTFYFNF